jgi:hypothetical protein
MGSAVIHTASRVDDAWEAAYKDALVLPSWEQAGYLLDTIGPRFTTAAVGLQDARTVRRWREATMAPREHDVAARLAILYRLTRVIADVYSPDVAMAFLRSSNPQLDDDSPLMVLREGDPEETQKPLLAAVRAFLEG